MKLFLKQHIFTWGDRFTVYDEGGGDRYYVEGEVFSWGKKLHLYDLDGRELSYIEQKLLTFLPKYEIYINGLLAAEVVKEFTLFYQAYTVNGPGWSVEGDFLSHDYCITDGAHMIASVAKEWFTLGDAYSIDISPTADLITALSTVLVIDACLADSN